MSLWKSRLAALILVLVLLLSSTQMLEARVEDGLPRIEVYRLLFAPTTIKVYVYPDSLDVKTGDTFTCPYRDKVIPAFYEVLGRLRKSLIRFADEYPEYGAIIDIKFVNATSAEEADLVLKIVRGWRVSRTLLSRVVTEERPNEIHITCEDAGMLTEPELRGVLMHELLHALGVGHAEAMWTDLHEPEVMLNISPDAYPTTLDLYAVYLAYFNPPDFGNSYITNITLPQGMQYKMVIPYDVELQRLKGENEMLRRRIKLMEAEMDKLSEQLRNASDIIEYLNTENQQLQMLNEALEEQLADLWGRLQTADIIISRLQGENEMLRANLSSCASLGLELGEKCNQTIRDLVNKYNNLSANYSLCLDYLAKYYSNAQWLKTCMWIITAAGLISVLTAYFTMKRHIRKLEKELEEAHKRLETLHGQERRS